MPRQNAIQNTGIDGLLLQPLAVIPAEGGPVLHMFRPDSPLFANFCGGPGEVYFSEVHPGQVTAWKLHTRQQQTFAVPSGLLKIVLYDQRPGSPTRGVLCELFLGRPDHYALLRIPPGIWYGFAAHGNSPALICNCADIAHDPTESRRLPADDPAIPYRWGKS